MSSGCNNSTAPKIDCSAPTSAAAGSVDGLGCPIFDTGGTCGTVSNSEIIEASGIVAGRQNPSVLWTHNDSGNAPCVYAIGLSGKYLGRYSIGGTNIDWEDIAAGPGPKAGANYLYLGDIGDNNLVRKTITILRFLEPTVPLGSALVDSSIADVESFSFAYPDKPHNAESLLVDPTNGDIYIVVKSDDGVSPIYRATAPLDKSVTKTLELVTTLHFGKAPLSGSARATGGDILPDGSGIAIRTYDCAYFWWRKPGQTIAEAFQSTACRLPMQTEDQGEAFGFSVDGKGYFSFSEGSPEPLYFYAWK